MQIDPARVATEIILEMQRVVRDSMRKKGAVVGVSGGVDSAVVLALSARAFGSQKVLAILMPERDSEAVSANLAHQLCAVLGVHTVEEDLTPALSGMGCYDRRDQAVRRMFPQYDAGAGYRMKIALPPNRLERDSFNAFVLTIVTPEGEHLSRMLPAAEFLQIVAASNMKQRLRMATLYYHAELRNFGVIGTTNKNEQDQGFFVKYGDGGVDVKAISHLFKTQVYQLAKYLDIPDTILSRAPTTDTYSAPCDQTEFFFRMPFEVLDLLWHAWETNTPAAVVAPVMGLSETQVDLAFRDFERKRRATEYLRAAPVPLQPHIAP